MTQGSNPNEGPLAIDLSGVSKSYGRRVRALVGVDIHVRRGEIYGLLGPNGAGKSTLVKVMMTIVRPDSIQGTVLGRAVGDKGALATIGYLPEHHRFPPYLTGRQVVEFSGAMSLVPRRERKIRAGALLDRVGLGAWGRRPLSSYSKGMRQRAGLAAALVNEPQLVVLDEPTDGVDPVGRREFRDLIVALRDEGRTVMLNSHLLSEVETVCSRVAIMVQGRVVSQGTIDELTASSRRYEIVIEGTVPLWCGTSVAVQAMPPGSLLTAGISGAGTRLVFLGLDAAAAQPILDRLRTEGRTVVAVQTVRESLEDLFMRAVTDPTTGLIFKPGAAS
ncbi:MAG: ABC transporter ATP-binding protein [Phycisphaerales bacterium]|nr:ABC transporter ATP-binding protein [Phycisphaerales bacterium]